MRKILVIEDDKFLGSAYRVKLAKAGFEVKLATDGNEGLAALQTFLPDLILLDLIMPVKDGFAVLAELKANPQWKNIPVIVASNLGQKEDVDKSKQLGAADFIVKSDLSLENVINKINAILEGQGAAGGVVPAPVIQQAVAQVPPATVPTPPASANPVPPTPIATPSDGNDTQPPQSPPPTPTPSS